MANVRAPIAFIDLTEDRTDDDEDQNNAVTHAGEVLSAKWQPREQPSRDDSFDRPVSKSSFTRQRSSIDDSSNVSSDEADTIGELSRTWHARVQREPSSERRTQHQTEKTKNLKRTASRELKPLSHNLPTLIESTTTKPFDTQKLFALTESGSRSNTHRPINHATDRALSSTTLPNTTANPKTLTSRTSENIPLRPNLELSTPTGPPTFKPPILPRPNGLGDKNTPIRLNGSHASQLHNNRPQSSNQLRTISGITGSGASSTQALNGQNSALYNFPVSDGGGSLLPKHTLTSGKNQALSMDERIVSTNTKNMPKSNKLPASPHSNSLTDRPNLNVGTSHVSNPVILVNPVNIRTDPPDKGIKSQAPFSGSVEKVIRSMLAKSEAVTPAEVTSLNSLMERTRNSRSKHFSADEDELLLFLKERTTLKWNQFGEYFPSRSSWQCLQSRYQKIHKPRVRDARRASVTSDGSSRSFSPPNPDVLPFQSQLRKSKRSGVLRRLSRETPLPVAIPGDDTDRGNSRQRLLENQHENTEIPITSNDDFKSLISRETSEPVPFYKAGENIPRGTPPYQPSQYDRVRPLQLMPRENIVKENLRDAAALASQTLLISRQPVLQAHENQSSHYHNAPCSIKRKRRSIDVQRPYLDLPERTFLHKSSKSSLWNAEEAIGWEGKVLHVDFLDGEIEVLKPSILAIRTAVPKDDLPFRVWAAEALKHAPEEDISRISRHAQYRGVFLNRTKNSMDSFLRDLAGSTVNSIPSFQSLLFTCRHKPNSIGQHVRNRELGLRPTHKEGRQGLSNMQSAVFDTLGPHLIMSGGSGDVTNVAWSPNGELFAAGCAALTDEHSMQYNQRNNLLLGDVTTKVVRELPEHAETRRLAPSGANSTREMHISQDSLLFSSISSVQFSPDGCAMFSAGYDKVARVWDVRKDRTRTDSIDDATCVMEFRHRANIDLLALNTNGLFATGTQRNSSSIKVFRYDLDTSAPRTLKSLSLSSHRAEQRLEFDLIPSCMRWGHEIYQQHRYLLCGFSSRAKEFGEGETCIWDVEAERPTAIERGSRNVFDVAWSPSIFGRFAVGSTPDPKSVNRGTHSIVRIYDSRLKASLQVNSTRTIELECPALDMNDIVFNPKDDFLLSTGCTDGVTYVWDLRKPDDLLHRLGHGHSLTPLDESRPSEESDTGVRFVSWDYSRRRLYTGSSDGVVAVWNPYLSQDDAHIRDVVQLNSGVMSGAFSPDFSNLLVGEVSGSVSLLSVGNQDKTTKDFERFTLQAADELTLEDVRRRVGATSALSHSKPDIGIATARALLENDEMEVRDCGDMPIRQAVQGVRYSGPFDKAADAPTLRAKAREFQSKLRPSKDFCTINHEIPQITEEERGDSRTWQMRIPERLRWPKKDSQPQPPRKDFVCFRCHKTNLISPAAHDQLDVLACASCKLAWRVDVLGYTPVDFATHEPLSSWGARQKSGREVDVSSSSRVRQSIEHDDDEAALADVTMYHHSFWKDRSPSPL